MSEKPFWEEDPTDADVSANDGQIVGNSAGDDAPLLANELFGDLGAVTELEAGAIGAWPIWRVEKRYIAPDDADEWENVEITVIDSEGTKRAWATLPATADHPAGALFMPVAPHDARKVQLLALAHYQAGEIERLKAAAPDTAIETYLQWIHDDGLPGRIEQHLNTTRPRWHRVLVDYFLPQFPPLWEAPSVLADPDDPADPDDMPQWQKQIRTVYGLEAMRVVVTANAMHAKTEHALHLAHATVHDPAVWRDHARDAIAHAAMWMAAVHDPVTGDLDMQASIQGALAPHVMARAVIYLGETWARDALNRYRDALQDDVAHNPDRWKALLSEARETLGLPPVEITLTPRVPGATRDADPRLKRLRQTALPIPTAPAFDENRIAQFPTAAPWIGMLDQLWEPWNVPDGVWPERRVSLDKGKGLAVFTFRADPTGASETERLHAIEQANKITPTVALTARAIGLLYMPNRRHRGRMAVDTKALEQWIYIGGRSRRERLKEINRAMFLLEQLIVQHVSIKRKGKGGRETIEPLANGRARHLLTFDELGRSGDNITYDIQLGEPILEALTVFYRQVGTTLQDAIQYDGRQWRKTRFAVWLESHQNHIHTLNSWERRGMAHREILQIMGYTPDEIDNAPRNKRRERKQDVREALNQPKVCSYRYEHSTPEAVDSLYWKEWLDTTALITVHRRTAPELPPPPGSESADIPR